MSEQPVSIYRTFIFTVLNILPIIFASIAKITSLQYDIVYSAKLSTLSIMAISQECVDRIP